MTRLTFHSFSSFADFNPRDGNQVESLGKQAAKYWGCDHSACHVEHKYVCVHVVLL